jgi:flagellar basal body-associated protein FliL
LASEGYVSDEAIQPAAVESKPRKRWIGVLVVLVLVVGAGATGALVSLRLASHVAQAAPAKTPSRENAEPEDIPPPLELEGIVVDVRDSEGSPHHIKIGLAIELTPDAVPDHVKNLMPRGREAVISYLRSQSFDELTGPKRFPTVSHELSTEVTRAFGKKRVARVVITDFVSQ